MAAASTFPRAEVERLYGLPLEEFTAARDDLVRRLRKEGRRDDAGELSRLRKPTLAAWVVNQLRRRRPAEIEALVANADELARAQAELLEGADRGALAEASRNQRRLIGELTAEARALLEGSGRPATAAVMQAVEATLHAVGLDPETRELVADGRLTREREASGLGLLAPATAPSPSKRRGAAKPTRRKSDPALEKRLVREQERARDAGERLEAAVEQLRRARREAARAASALERAESDEERARKSAAKATDRVREAERRLRAARAG